MTEDIAAILKQYPDSLTARRWLKNPKALEVIWYHHDTWNADHERMKQPDMIFTLEESIEIYLDQPENIDQYL